MDILNLLRTYTLTDNGSVQGQFANSELDDIVGSEQFVIPDEWLEDYEERAAILEYDGGLPRGQAEAQAKIEIFNRLMNSKQ